MHSRENRGDEKDSTRSEDSQLEVCLGIPVARDVRNAGDPKLASNDGDDGEGVDFARETTNSCGTLFLENHNKCLLVKCQILEGNLICFFFGGGIFFFLLSWWLLWLLVAPGGFCGSLWLLVAFAAPGGSWWLLWLLAPRAPRSYGSFIIYRSIYQ